MSVVHINSGTTRELLHFRCDFDIRLIGLHPAITLSSSAQSFGLSGFFSRQVFRRVLVSFDDVDDILLIVALPTPVSFPFISVHHHDGKFKASILCIKRSDVLGQGILGNSRKRKAEEQKGYEVGSHGGGSRGGRNIPQRAATVEHVLCYSGNGGCNANETVNKGRRLHGNRPRRAVL